QPPPAAGVVHHAELLAERMEIDVETLFTHVDAGIDCRHRIFGYDLALHAGPSSPSSVQAEREKDGRIQLHLGSDPGVHDPARPTAGGGHPRRSPNHPRDRAAGNMQGVIWLRIRDRSPLHQLRWSPSPSRYGEAEALPPLAAPAPYHPADHGFFFAGLAPEFGEEGVGGGRAAVAFEVVEGDPDRNGDALAADDALAVAECGDDVEEAARAFRHGGFHEMLVALVVQTHRDDRAALGEHAL